MLKNNRTNGNNKVVILVTHAYEEAAVVYCLDSLRDKGIPVTLVSLTAGLVSGLHGLSLRPDLSLDQLGESNNIRLIIVPGSRQCTSSLLSDPRVHTLLQATWQHEGYVAAAGSAGPLLAEARIIENGRHHQYITQENIDLPAFTERLIDLLLA